MGRIRGILSAHFPWQGGIVRFLFRSSVDQVWQSLVTEVIKKRANVKCTRRPQGRNFDPWPREALRPRNCIIQPLRYVNSFA